MGKKNPKLFEPAPYTGVGDDSDDNYEDCDLGGDDFDDNDGAVAGADWNLKPAMANLTKSSHFCFSIQFCKQPALELPQNRRPAWQTPQRHWPVHPWMVVTMP